MFNFIYNFVNNNKLFVHRVLHLWGACKWWSKVLINAEFICYNTLLKTTELAIIRIACNILYKKKQNIFNDVQAQLKIHPRMNKIIMMKYSDSIQ
jgi:hypothetical protein